jgi:DNA-binding protein HU-beta
VSVTATHIAPFVCENAARVGRKAAQEDDVAGISKSETLNRLSEKTGLTKKQVGTVLEELAGLAYKEARNGFTFPGVGKLVIVDRKARLGRNPATGETIQIPAKRVLKFRIAKQAKDSTLAKRGK